MLEKIGLPPKPSVRGNNWVIDASHCQGCSSQFTFINRKHHCRRCGGLFCGSCTQQRMYLRGQGESPVRICEPCKTLEEAARFEMRYGHKNKSKRVLGDGGNESVSSDKESVHSLQRATSASCSNNDMELDLESTTPEELRQRAVEEKKKYKVLKAEGKPEEALRAFKRGKELERQAGTLEIELRKNRRKALSSSSANESTKVGVGKQPKEKDDLVSELRELGWSDLDLHDADKKPVSMTLEGELSTLLKEVSQKTTNPEKGSFGIDKSEVVAIKKNALALKREGKLAEAKEELKRAKILEKQIEERELLGDDEDSDDEFSLLVRSMGIDKHDVLATGNDRDRNFDFDHLLRMDDVPNIDGNFEVTEEDMDDPEISAALQSLGWTEDHAVDNKEARLSEIRSLKLEALNKKRAGNTAEAMALLKKAKLLESDQENDGLHQGSAAAPLKLDSDRKTAPKSKLAIQRELLALKKKALALRREGKTDEADQELMNGKALEQQLEELENGPKVKPAATKGIDLSAPMDVQDEGEDVTDTDMNDPSYLSLLQNLGWKDEDDGKVEAAAEPEPPKRKSKTEIQRELLALKRKSLALRRQGNVDEAEEVLQKTKNLESQLAEMDVDRNAGGETVVSEVFMAEKDVDRSAGGETVVSEVFMVEKPQTSTVAAVFVDDKPRVDAHESGSVQQRILAHKRKAVSLKREGRIAEAKEELKQAKLLEKENTTMENKNLDSETGERTPVPSTSKTNGSDVVHDTRKEETDDSPPKLSSRDRFKLQQESLSHKRQALKLRREGRTEEADAEFELAKNLESQLEAANESTKPARNVDDVSVEDLLDPQLLSALREVGIESSPPEKAKPVVNKIPAEAATAKLVINKPAEAATAKPVINKPAEAATAKPVINKPETANEDRTELEERIKAEKVKAVKLKRAGKQAEALDALRRAKLLEKKLISLA
ncbi:Tetratricopeptide-like helical [Cynara cardunculus var. scolymus]|uniref:Tetratricopeptide-like helical n=1 Tax=Cynara cardunculus var. scolymus TaxID=59895 RepID=A0A103XF96_CYNCS|nr:Tetratricopeptide-like helical [Cynara cardunculus var. scolymus]